MANDERRTLPSDRSLKVSAPVAQIVERVRTRFGVALEVVNASLQPIVPEAGGELLRAVEMCAGTREAVTAAMHAGRSRTIDIAESSFLIQPLRGGRGSRAAVGLLAIRQPGLGPDQGTAASTGEAERWGDFLRITIEADLAMSEDLREERLQARRTLAALRFLGQLATMESETDLARAVVHAAAVWFDVDARLYRRNFAGDFVLHTHLPGIPDASGRLNPVLVEDAHGIRRFSATEDIEGLRWAVPEALLVPIAVADEGWLLALGGVLSSEAKIVLQTVGEAMGSHLTRLAVARRAAARGRFEQIASQAARAPELVVMDTLRQVMEETGAASGAVTLFDAAGSRRLAAVGSLRGAVTPSAEARMASDRIACPVTFGETDWAVLELTPPPDGAFTDHAALIVREAAPVLQGILYRVARRAGMRDEEAAPEAPDAAAAFVARITEELERAKRFDLGLSMLLIDVDPQSRDPDILRDVAASVRAELRGSDVLGLVGHGRIAALLVHTDGPGVGVVVARLRQRLELLLQRLQVPALRLGRAVLTNDCKTTSDFLSQASRDVVAVVAA